MDACTLSLASLMDCTSFLASSRSMPWRSLTVWRSVLPAAFSGSTKSSAPASTLRRVIWPLRSSCICLSLSASSATTVSAASSRFTEDWLPLKSKRVEISRVTPASALSTSAMSTRETMSKLGMGCLLVGVTAPGYNSAVGFDHPPHAQEHGDRDERQHRDREEARAIAAEERDCGGTRRRRRHIHKAADA